MPRFWSFCDSATARFDALSTLRASPFFYLEPANLDDAMFEVFLAARQSGAAHWGRGSEVH